MALAAWPSHVSHLHMRYEQVQELSQYFVKAGKASSYVRYGSCGPNCVRFQQPPAKSPCIAVNTLRGTATQTARHAAYLRWQGHTAGDDVGHQHVLTVQLAHEMLVAVDAAACSIEHHSVVSFLRKVHDADVEHVVLAALMCCARAIAGLSSPPHASSFMYERHSHSMTDRSSRF